MPGQPKRVYVLGAGFSREAGFPLQNEILRRVIEFRLDLMQAPQFALEIFAPAREKVLKFLTDIFPDGQEPVLEDVFTLLDQSIARRESCRNYSWRDLDQVRDALKRAILFVFHQASRTVDPKGRSFYDALSASLIKQELSPEQDDAFSIILLNWDSLLEDSIFRVLVEVKGEGKVDIDYGCHTNALGGSPHMPSPIQKARGLFSIKVMKLHGSVNWLLCPSCGYLYTGVGGLDDVWEQYVRPRSCPRCMSLENNVEGIAPLLEPFFITPTFLKVFDNVHMQMIWQRTYDELSSANEIVFIGYSFPDADYQVRALLRRAVGPGTQITTVLTSQDEPTRNSPLRIRGSYPVTRYRAFFGEDRVIANLRGVRGFFARIVGGRRHAFIKQQIRRDLASVRRRVHRPN